MNYRIILSLFVVSSFVLPCELRSDDSSQTTKTHAAPAEDNQSASDKHDDSASNRDTAPVFKKLFDGKSLKGWKPTEFGGEGDVLIKEGEIILDYGGNLTGITYTGQFPKNNFEIVAECRRIEGTDFFCGLTFPVGDSHCSVIFGGWGGAVVGLSNVDDYDASMNDTTQIIGFEKGRWYTVRVRVTDDSIDVWLDKKKIISQPRKGHEFSLRPEVLLCRPLGFASFATQAGIRSIKFRELSENDLKKESEQSAADTDHDSPTPKAQPKRK